MYKSERGFIYILGYKLCSKSIYFLKIFILCLLNLIGFYMEIIIIFSYQTETISLQQEKLNLMPCYAWE